MFFYSAIKTPRIILVVLKFSVCYLLVICVIGCSSQHEQSSELIGAADRSQNCKSCHLEQWNDWHASPHATSWTSDAIQAAFHNFGFSRKCQSCHAPEPILTSGLDTPPILRNTAVASGVNCLSCHGLGEVAGVAAIHGNTNAACQPVKIPAISSSHFCGVCHVPIFDDWSGSRYASEGRTCVNCHMEDKINGKVSHRCNKLLATAKYQNSIEMKCFQQTGKIVAEVTNRGVGHNFPGERHNRTLSVKVIQRDKNGDVQSAQKNLIKGITPFRGESTQDKIKVDETVRCQFPLFISEGVVEVTLLLKQFPWISDSEATVVAKSEIEL